VNLRWSWEARVPELDTSLFVIPRSFVKNGLDRYVVLNRIAKSVIEGCRGEHREFVFTHTGQAVERINNSGWKVRVVEPLSDMRISLEGHARRDFDPSGFMTSSTRMDTGCALRVLGSRIA
jgi:hypothetical protein